MTIRIAASQEDFFRLIRLREDVFVREQGVSQEIELDDDDDRAIHLVAKEGGAVLGTARLLVDSRGRNEKTYKIGRMAVAKGRRGEGIGSRLMEWLLKRCKRLKAERIELHAQEHAVPFYRRFDFVPLGRHFIEAGIPHRKMIRRKG